ncbi:unnamed protein product, partial [Polarella glacialis]
VLTRTVVGFSGGVNREEELLVAQRGKDRLFTMQRRLSKDGIGEGDMYRIQVYDAPLATHLHSYIVVVTPLESSPLAAAGLPVALPAHEDFFGGEEPGASAEAACSYMLKVDDKVLEDLLWGAALLDPSRQEELLHTVCQSLCLDKDRNEQLRLCLRKRRPKPNEIVASGARAAAMAMAGQGCKAPSAHAAGGIDTQDSMHSREIGGGFPLVRLRRAKEKLAREKKGADALSGPSLVQHSAEDRKFLGRDWIKLHRMEQLWGGQSVVITVSKNQSTYKVSVYEPKTSSNYEMCLVTSTCSTPLNILMERCELTTKLDLMLCIYEVAFPHQVNIVVEHISSQQEFKLSIGDDEVYTMIENSRKDAFTLFLDQLVHCGCVAGGGGEDAALATIFEETFAGNQIFTRMIAEDGTGFDDIDGDLAALAPQAMKKQRVPVIRTQLDSAGGSDAKNAPSSVGLVGGLTMTLLYHAEHIFAKDGETLMLRVHKKISSGDIAFTLRVRSHEGLTAPDEPMNSQRAAKQALDSGANGRPFETPGLAAGEGSLAKEVTIWMQDKCSYAPCGLYGEVVEVPGFSKQVALLITDEDAPRAIRVAVVLAQLPFTVLFQVVLLESSEGSAKVELTSELKPLAGRKVLKNFFERVFLAKGAGSSGVLMHLANEDEAKRHQDLRNQLDEIGGVQGMDSNLGMDIGPGSGGPIGASKSSVSDETLDVAILYMCTRRKMNRMMVFTVFRDIIAHHMYLRVVMHDPVAKRDFHVTLLHYTTQRLLDTLRINRDMLEDAHSYHDETEKK